MRTNRFAIPVALAFCFFAATLLRAQSQGPTVLTIHADQPVCKVSPTLYGLMTEEINYSYDGGLYAEMVRNRTFGRLEGVHYWFLRGRRQRPRRRSGSTRPPARARPCPAACDSTSARPMPPTRPACSTKATGASPLRPNTDLQGLVLRQGGLRRLGPVTVSLVRIRQRQSPGHRRRFRRRHGLEAVRIHAEDRRDRALARRITSSSPSATPERSGSTSSRSSRPPITIASTATAST